MELFLVNMVVCELLRPLYMHSIFLFFFIFYFSTRASRSRSLKVVVVVVVVVVVLETLRKTFLKANTVVTSVCCR